MVEARSWPPHRDGSGNGDGEARVRGGGINDGGVQLVEMMGEEKNDGWREV